MSRILFFLFFSMLSLPLWSQQTIETHRKAAFLAWQKGNVNEAIQEYASILKIDTSDYDARLALGRLYFNTGDYDSSLYYFQKIYQNDSTDVEALNGFTACFIQAGKMDTAIKTAERAVALIPESVPEYLLLAKALSYDGQIEHAIHVYHLANQQDSTYAQVWAGLGKMYYWKSKPATALKYYRKALALDPQDQTIILASQLVENELKYHTRAQFNAIQEMESTYQINAFLQSYAVQKRLGDHFQFSVHFVLDFSNRDYIIDNPMDTSRWFDNSWVKTSWITTHHQWSAYGGYSSSDALFSTYGLSWKYQNSFGKIKFENTIDAGYTYFYYWNQVGRHAISDKIKLEYARFTFNADINTGQVDEMKIRKYSSDPYTTGTNPYFAYNISLNYKIIKNPDIKLGINHSYYDYNYISPLYYTPNDRLLIGPSLSLYQSVNDFYFYAMGIYQLGTERYYYLETNSGNNGQGNSTGQVEKSGTIDATNWSAAMEAGYNWKAVSLSAGASRFYNPYYKNFVAFIKISLEI
ncbi:MAG: tetratricopeptide repeat protein [Bacteroidia bacterium]|nr:tetratricopeptide repeat protein [Bacteroidia bacterium]